MAGMAGGGGWEATYALAWPINLSSPERARWAAVTPEADQCHRLPDNLSFSEAAAMGVVYDTSWVALRSRARLTPGETVLVLGAAGGVGHAAMQLARAMGARILAGISRPERAAAARAAGADAIIDLSRDNLRDSLRDQ